MSRLWLSNIRRCQPVVLSGKTTALRLLARRITRLRPKFERPTLRRNRFDDGEWKIAVVETAREGLPVHQARPDDVRQYS